MKSFQKCAILCMALIISGICTASTACTLTMPNSSTSSDCSVEETASSSSEESSSSLASADETVDADEAQVLQLGDNLLAPQDDVPLSLTFTADHTGYYSFVGYGISVESERGDSCGEQLNAAPVVYRLETGETLTFTCSKRASESAESDGSETSVFTVQRVLGMGEQSIFLQNGQAVLEWYADAGDYFCLLPTNASLELCEDGESYVAVTGVFTLTGATRVRLSSTLLEELSFTVVQPVKAFERSNSLSLQDGKAYALFTANDTTTYACTLSQTGSVRVLKSGVFQALQYDTDLVTTAGATYLLEIESDAENKSVTLTIASNEIRV